MIFTIIIHIFTEKYKLMPIFGRIYSNKKHKNRIKSEFIDDNNVGR